MSVLSNMHGQLPVTSIKIAWVQLRERTRPLFQEEISIARPVGFQKGFEGGKGRWLVHWEKV